MPGKAALSTCWKSTCESAVAPQRGRAPRQATDTSPPETRTVPAAVSTTSRPSGAMPRAVPAVSPTLTARPQRASRAESPACSGARPCRDPAIVGCLERGEEIPEQRRTLALDPVDGTQGRRRRPGLGRQLGLGLVDVQADPENDCPLARLGQDSRHLATLDEHVVRPLDAGGAPKRTLDGLGGGEPTDERQFRRLPPGRGPQENRAEDRGARGREPGPAEAPASGGLLLAHRHCPFGQVRCERSLRRVAANRVEVGIAEPAAKKRRNRVRRQRAGHRAK